MIDLIIFTQVFVPKLEKQVQELIKNHGKDKQHFLKEVEKILPFKDYLSPELREQLTTLLKTYQSETSNPIKHPWPWIVGLGTIALITLGTCFYLAKKIIKKFLLIWLFPIKSNK